MKNDQLANYIKQNKKLLEKGEVLTVALLDGVATIFNKRHPESSEQSTVTLIDPYDAKFDFKIAEIAKN